MAAQRERGWGFFLMCCMFAEGRSREGSVLGSKVFVYTGTKEQTWWRRIVCFEVYVYFRQNFGILGSMSRLGLAPITPLPHPVKRHLLYRYQKLPLYLLFIFSTSTLHLFLLLSTTNQRKLSWVPLLLFLLRIGNLLLVVQTYQIYKARWPFPMNMLPPDRCPKQWTAALSRVRA